MSATHTEASGDELDDILIHGTIWNTRLEPGSNDWPKLVVNPEAKHKLHSLMVRERIDELKYLWKCERGRHTYFYDEETRDAFTTADRIAALEAQLEPAPAESENTPVSLHEALDQPIDGRPML